jgi:uncharacterized protein (TIGR03086 family)
VTDLSSARERYRRAAGPFGAVVRSVPSDAWQRPTPCDGWVARDVVIHLVEWIPAVLGAGGVDFDGLPDANVDPVAAWDGLDRGLDSALLDASTAARRFTAGLVGELSVAEAIERLVIGDLVVHTWDLATATGLDAHIDQALAAEQLEGLQAMDAMLRASGHFGPEVPVVEDADVVTRLVAFTGRDPNRWSPD